MIPLLALALALGAPLLGAVVTTRVSGPERRWAALIFLVCSLAGTGVAAAIVLAGPPISWGQGVAEVRLGALAGTLTPPIVLAGIVLILTATRRETTPQLLSGILTVIGMSLLALLVSHPAAVLAAEAAAAAATAGLMIREERRATAIYLTGSTAAFLAAAAGALAHAGPVTGLPDWVVGFALLAALLRLGVFPLSTGLFAAARSRVDTVALVAILPLGGVVTLATVVAPTVELGRVLHPVTAVLLVGAVGAAALALVQSTLRRSIAALLGALYALIALGVLDPSPTAVIGGEVLWAGVLLAATGLGATTALVEARFGALDLREYQGLHTVVPGFSGAFLALGISLTGAPGTVDFIATDVLLTSATVSDTLGMAAIAATLALVGLNVLRLQFRVFHGAARPPDASLAPKPRERLALGLVVSAVLLGGLAPTLLPLASPASTPPTTHASVLP